VLAYLIADTRDPVLAEDLAQDFVLWALEKDFFGTAPEDRGKFRSFLLRSLERFAILEESLIDPAPEGSERPTMAKLSAKYGVTAKQVETWLNWGKDALKDELLQEISFYSRTQEEQAEELAGLLDALYVA
jgi:hypothetical protein